MLKLVFEEPV